MSALAIAPEPASQSIILVPDERVLAMIASCADQIARATTLADAREVTDVAEAVAAVARKIKVAKEVKHAAVRLLVEAESKLGEITRAIPPGKGGRGHKAPKRKADVLAANGISKARANLAERLNVAPPSKIDEVIASGANTLHGIYSRAGFQTNNYTLRERKASAIAFLCEEAVALLDRSVKGNKVPHAGTVAEMVQRLKSITAHGNQVATWPKVSR